MVLPHPCAWSCRVPAKSFPLCMLRGILPDYAYFQAPAKRLFAADARLSKNSHLRIYVTLSCPYLCKPLFRHTAHFFGTYRLALSIAMHFWSFFGELCIVNPFPCGADQGVCGVAREWSWEMAGGLSVCLSGRLLCWLALLFWWKGGDFGVIYKYFVKYV